MILAFALPIVLTVIEEGEVQVTKPIVFVVLRELVITEVVEEKEPVMVDSLVIKAIVEVLPIATEE